ncbi:MAG: hypothetical protein QOH50_5058 [Kribbellaceae bacterium]|nr:hypothetical protein [Kribbellaceae bacterium]
MADRTGPGVTSTAGTKCFTKSDRSAEPGSSTTGADGVDVETEGLRTNAVGLVGKAGVLLFIVARSLGAGEGLLESWGNSGAEGLRLEAEGTTMDPADFTSDPFGTLVVSPVFLIGRGFGFDFLDVGVAPFCMALLSAFANSLLHSFPLTSGCLGCGVVVAGECMWVAEGSTGALGFPSDADGVDVSWTPKISVALVSIHFSNNYPHA